MDIAVDVFPVVWVVADATVVVKCVVDHGRQIKWISDAFYGTTNDSLVTRE